MKGRRVPARQTRVITGKRKKPESEAESQIPKKEKMSVESKKAGQEAMCVAGKTYSKRQVGCPDYARLAYSHTQRLMVHSALSEGALG